MQIDTRWHPYIPLRRSRRRFDGRLPDDVSLDRIEELCAGFRPAHVPGRPPTARVVLARGDSPEHLRAIDRVFTGLLGSYGKILGAPCALIFLHDTAAPLPSAPSPQPDPWAAAGYTGEALILEATRLGLATCWITGTFQKDAAAAFVAPEPGEKIIGVSPVGYAAPDKAFVEKAIGMALGSRKRLSENVIAPGWSEWPEWAHHAVAAARLAPSARNSQAWRFRWDGAGLTVSFNLAQAGTGMTASKCRLDCGIAMLHAELAAQAHGVRGNWTFLPSPDVAVFQPVTARTASTPQ